MEAPAPEPPAGSSSCDRCGDFAPLTPIGARFFCASCISKRHPILSEQASAGLYVVWSFKLIRTMGLPAAAMWAASSALTTLVYIALEMASGVSSKATEANLVVGAAGTALYLLGYAFSAGFQTALAVQAIDGVVDWRAALRRAVARFPALVGTAIIASTVVLLGCMCCLLPGMAVSLLWALPFPAILAHGVGPISALGRSMEAMKDAWVPIGLALAATSLFWFVGYMVVTLPTSGYLLYEMVEHGPTAMAEVAQTTWVRVASLATTAFASLMYIPLVNTAAVAYLNRTEGAK